jgi:hypothetical protein
MNSKTVLGKIMALLSKEEVKLTYAKLADGTIVESATFDVGEPIEVVTEEGKSAAPDGEHELFLKDEEGNEVRIRVIVKDGVIVERENVEELEDVEIPADADEKQVDMEEEMLPESEEKEEVTINLEDVAKALETMSYRVEELEKRLAEMQVEEEVKEEEVMEEDEELPKLDGAPLEASAIGRTKMSTKGTKVGNLQSAFLSKLYN